MNADRKALAREAKDIAAAAMTALTVGAPSLALRRKLDRLIDQLAADGKTTGAEAAMAIVAAEKANKQAALAAFKADGALGVAQPAAPAAEAPPAEDNRPIEQQAKDAWDKDAKLRTEFGGNFDSYLAFRKHEGSIRILKRKDA
jgi:uncharacterized membrane protein